MSIESATNECNAIAPSTSTPFAGFARPTANYYRLPNTWFDLWHHVRGASADGSAPVPRINGLLLTMEFIIKWSWGHLNFDRPVRITYDEFQRGRRRATRPGQRGTAVDLGTGLSPTAVRHAIETLVGLGLVSLAVDDSDRARVKHWYLPRLEEPEDMEEGDLTAETDHGFTGFQLPEASYFPVPHEWTNLSRTLKSAAAILTVEYLMRHTFGWRDAARWLTPIEIATGRRYREDLAKRYDEGIHYSRPVVARACDDLVDRGILVWRPARVDLGREQREYCLRMQGMVVDETGEWIDPLEAEVTSAPSASDVRGREPAKMSEGGALMSEDGVLNGGGEGLNGEDGALTHEGEALEGENEAPGSEDGVLECKGEAPDSENGVLSSEHGARSGIYTDYNTDLIPLTDTTTKPGETPTTTQAPPYVNTGSSVDVGVTDGLGGSERPRNNTDTQLAQAGFVRGREAVRAEMPNVPAAPLPISRNGGAAVSHKQAGAGHRTVADRSYAEVERVRSVLDCIGITEPVRSQLLAHDRVWDAGYLEGWAAYLRHHPDIGPGLVITNIRKGVAAPQEAATIGEMADRLALEQPHTDPVAVDAPEQADGGGGDTPGELDRLWQASLAELRLQMARSTFDTWVRSTRLEGVELLDTGDVAAGGGPRLRLVIAAANTAARDWLENRFYTVIRRTVYGILSGGGCDPYVYGINGGSQNLQMDDLEMEFVV
jgi:hypothetical protein